MYTKSQFGKNLETELNDGFDTLKIARWAYLEFVDGPVEMEDGLETIILKIMAMEEGEEFGYTESQLRELASVLQDNNRNLQ